MKKYTDKRNTKIGSGRIIGTVKKIIDNILQVDRKVKTWKTQKEENSDWDGFLSKQKGPDHILHSLR